MKGKYISKVSGTSAFRQLNMKYKDFFLVQMTSFLQEPIIKILSSPTSDEVLKVFSLDLNRVLKVYRLKNMNLDFHVNVPYHSGKDLLRINKELSKHVRKSNYFAVGFSQSQQIVKNDKMYKNLMNLRSFSVRMNEFSALGDDKLRILLSNISKYMKRLKNLRLNMQSSIFKDVGKEGRKGRKSRNFHLKKLKNLSVNLERCNQFSNQGLKEIGLRIAKNSKSLESLSMKMISCDSLSDQGIQEFACLLGSNLRYIKTCNIDLSACNNIRKGSLSSLLTEFAIKLESLQELSLQFRRCQHLGSESIVEEQVSNNNSQNKNLKKVSLNFEKSGIRLHQGSQRFLEIFRLLPKSIQELRLNLTSCKGINNEFIRGLGKNLSVHAENLQLLWINFGWCSDLGNESVIEIGEQISYPLKALNDISFCFGWSDNISDECFGNFVSNLSSNPKNVKKLLLRFEGYSKITNDGLKELMSKLEKEYRNLQYLNLGFRGCRGVSDEGLKHLNSEIKHLDVVEQLGLDFRGCSQLTDKSLEHISSGSKERRTKSLELYFSRCPLLTDQGLEVLSQNLKTHWKSLQKVYLDVSDCENIITQPPFLVLSSGYQISWKNGEKHIYNATLLPNDNSSIKQKIKSNERKSRNLCSLI